MYLLLVRQNRNYRVIVFLISNILAFLFILFSGDIYNIRHPTVTFYNMYNAPLYVSASNTVWTGVQVAQHYLFLTLYFRRSILFKHVFKRPSLERDQKLLRRTRILCAFDCLFVLLLIALVVTLQMSDTHKVMYKVFNILFLIAILWMAIIGMVTSIKMKSLISQLSLMRLEDKTWFLKV